MSKSLWQLQAEGKVVTTLDDTDLIYILRDPVTGRLDRIMTGANLKIALGGGVHNHDDLYYTEAEINTLVSGLSVVGHTHVAGNLDSLSDVIITTPSNTQVLKYNGTNWVNAADAGGGGGAIDDLTDVTLVAAAVGDILRFNGTVWVDYPDSNYAASVHNHDASYFTEAEVTSLLAGYSLTSHNHSGVYQPLDTDLTTIAGLTATTDNIIQSVGSAWASRTPAQVLTALGLVIGTNVQAFDADLTTLAGLTATTDNMIQSVAGVWASRTPAQIRTALALGSFAQLSSLNLDGLSDVIIATPSTGQVLKYNGTNWVDAVGGAFFSDLAHTHALTDLIDIALVAAATGDLLRYNGTSWVDYPDSNFAASGHNHTGVYQPIDTDLTTIAGLTPTTDNFLVAVASAWASRTPAQVRTTLGLIIGTNVQAWDADLDTIAGLTATTNNFMVASGSAWASRTPAQALAHLGLDADLPTLSVPASTTISTFGASLVDDANAAAAIATLGLDADIATLVLPASTTISAFAATILDDTAAVNVRTTIDAAQTAHSHTSLKERDYSVGGTLIVSIGVLRMYFKRAVTITNVMASVNTAPTGASIIIDVNKDGTTIFTGGTNRPEIAISGFVDLTAVPAVTALAAGSYLTFDIDQIGSTIAGANLVITVEFTESIT